jgi:hypothetical protein
VESELKGVKLFVKRGNKGFTGGMPGHIKLLSRSGSDDERLRALLYLACYDLAPSPFVF